jgi:4a-hydroxytetrahydrobiopterin dehydratase
MTSSHPSPVTVYDEPQAAARLQQELPHWSLAQGQLQRVFKTAGWKGTLMVVNAIGHLAELAWHHPDLLVSYPSVTVRLTTHDAGGLTDKDFELARQIEAVVMWRPQREPGSALEGTPDDPRYAYLISD